MKILAKLLNKVVNILNLFQFWCRCVDMHLLVGKGGLKPIQYLLNIEKNNLLYFMLSAFICITIMYITASIIIFIMLIRSNKFVFTVCWLDQTFTGKFKCQSDQYPKEFFHCFICHWSSNLFITFHMLNYRVTWLTIYMCTTSGNLGSKCLLGLESFTVTLMEN